MSRFGGDSWGREAQCRKRRLDDLMLHNLDNNNNKEEEDSSSSSSYKKLCNGKYACLICPNNPIFDSSLMLSMHKKGSRHVAAESRLKERELMRREEIKKRVALSDNSVASTTSCGSSNKKFQLKPLIERTVKATSELLAYQKPERSVRDVNHNLKFDEGSASFFSPSSSIHEPRIGSSPNVKSGSFTSDEGIRGRTTKASDNMLAKQPLELLRCRERELKFTAAGWKRDCHGRWFKDENVEFDSDEEDPNICLP